MTFFQRAALVTALVFAPSVTAGCAAPAEEETSAADDEIVAATDAYLVTGGDVSPRARERIAALLARALGREVRADVPPALSAKALVIAVGDTPLARNVVPDDRVARLGAEGFAVKSAPFRGGTLLAARGKNKIDRPTEWNLGALHGAYAILEELGFAFLHPLAPTVPEKLRMPTAAIDRDASPRWKTRAIHLHTMHPIELTEMLQGFGPGGPSDGPGFEKSLDEWDRYLEWLVANGQNGVEWYLLWAREWATFADSPDRIARLRTLVDRGHDFGVAVGIDAPIAFQQQHSYRLLRTQGELAAELAEIRTRLDWLMTARFDFVGIEAGTSEFTHPKPERMLAWMNEVAKHLGERYRVPAFIKVHCSTGQKAEGFADPRTGGPINFNELPHHADRRLGVLPHTVQHYGLTDPAPTYGNTDFGYIRSFTRQEAKRRPVLFYPETAYWVSFDIDVPLFLPLYADRRLSDLRLLAGDEIADGDERMDGQLVFSSGWEWGYWLNDVVAARAAWSPELDAPTQREALRRALVPVVRPFGRASAQVTDWLLDVVDAEQQLLIEGKVAGRAPRDIVKRNGQAYLQGWETWDDVNEIVDALPIGKTISTQPSKLGLVQMRNPLATGGVKYTGEIDLLLTEMDVRFNALSARAEALRASIPRDARDLFDDLADAMKMTALRAAQVHGLYDYVDLRLALFGSRRGASIDKARRSLDAAKNLVAARERRYRVPADRVASWRNNPTAYEYGYLWSVRSLHYWWRDEAKAVLAPVSPCYMNIVNPIDVAFGEGIGTDAARLFGDVLSSDDQRGCIAEPASEPRYPFAGVRR